MPPSDWITGYSSVRFYWITHTPACPTAVTTTLPAHTFPYAGSAGVLPSITSSIPLISYLPHYTFGRAHVGPRFRPPRLHRSRITGCWRPPAFNAAGRMVAFVAWLAYRYRGIQQRYATIRTRGMHTLPVVRGWIRLRHAYTTT